LIKMRAFVHWQLLLICEFKPEGPGVILAKVIMHAKVLF